jgi:hypothetical protein
LQQGKGTQDGLAVYLPEDKKRRPDLSLDSSELQMYANDLDDHFLQT